MLCSSNKVVEGHCHLASLIATPKEFILGIAKNMASDANARGTPIPVDSFARILEEQQNDDFGDKLVEEQRNAGISKACLLAPDFSYVFEGATPFKELIEHHIEVCNRHREHFRLFAGIDPRWGNEGYDYFESLCQSQKVSGLKLYPPCGYSISDPSCDPLYEICQQYGIPVLFHTGPTSPTLNFRYSDPFLLDDAALRFSEVNFIAAHGAINLWEQHVLLAKYRPNIFLDISGFAGFTTGKCWKKHLNHIFNCGINHKIIFGTDWPVFKGKGDYEYVLNELFSYSHPEYEKSGQDDSEKILYKNIEGLLNNHI